MRMTVVSYDGNSTVLLWECEKCAERWYESQDLNWSEVYLCEVLRHPRTPEVHGRCECGAPERDHCRGHNG